MQRTGRRGKPALLLGLALILLMLIAACGEADANLGSGGNTTPTPTPTAKPSTPTPEPTEVEERNAVVVQIKHVGGFVPDHFVATRLPIFTLYDDGRVITQGPQIMIYPPPALPNLQQGTINDEGIQMILDAAREAGLLDGDKEYPIDVIADAATTVFTINVDGETHTVSVYALEMVEDEFIGDMIPEEEIEARQKIYDFHMMMLDYMSWLPDETIVEAEIEYPMEQLQVVVLPRDQYQVGDDTIDTGELDWPLATPLAEVGEEYTFMDNARCAVIDGAELDTLVDALREGNQLTTWLSDGEEYALLLRPLLPAESGCDQPQM